MRDTLRDGTPYEVAERFEITNGQEGRKKRAQEKIQGSSQPVIPGTESYAMEF